MLQYPSIDKMHQILTPEGRVVGELPDLPPEQLFSYYRWMIFGRVFSDRMVALQRQGRKACHTKRHGRRDKEPADDPSGEHELDDIHDRACNKLPPVVAEHALSTHHLKCS